MIKTKKHIDLLDGESYQIRKVKVTDEEVAGSIGPRHHLRLKKKKASSRKPQALKKPQLKNRISF